MFSWEFCEIYKNTLLYRTPLVAASVNSPKYAFEVKYGPIKTVLGQLLPRKIALQP